MGRIRIKQNGPGKIGDGLVEFFLPEKSKKCVLECVGGGDTWAYPRSGERGYSPTTVALTRQFSDKACSRGKA